MRSLLPRLAMIACLVVGALPAEEDPPATDPATAPPTLNVDDAKKTKSKELNFKQEMDELQQLSRPRSIYEFEVAPLKFDRVVLRDPQDNTRVYHYLVFRLRNRVADSGEALKLKYSRYNEVLDTIIQEYEGTAKEVEEGARLVVTETPDLGEDEQHLKNIVARDNLKVVARRVGITALVTDEIGTRFRALDPVPGEGPQEKFDFDNRGQDRVNILYQSVHDRVEELAGMRLFNAAEIRALEIPPYDPTKPSTFTTADGLPDGDGMAQGEVFGVLIFDRLNPVANRFTVQINGVSNSMRFTFPSNPDADPAAEPPLKVEDYYNLRVRRRAYVLEYERDGDEYYRDQDPFTLVRSGYQWVESFQRVKRRRTFALTRYFLNNIRLKEERVVDGTVTFKDATKLTADGKPTDKTVDVKVPVLVNPEVDDELRTNYARERDQLVQVYAGKIETARAKKARLDQEYEGDDPYDKDQRSAWNDLMDSYLKTLGDRKDELPKKMRDLWQDGKNTE